MGVPPQGGLGWKEGKPPHSTGDPRSDPRQKQLAQVGDGEGLNSQPAQPVPGKPASPVACTGPVARARLAQPVAIARGALPAAGTFTPSLAEPVASTAENTPVANLPLLAAAAPGHPRERIDSITAAVVANLTRQLDEAAHTCFQAYHDKMIRFTEQYAERAEANLQSAGTRRADRIVGSTRQQLDALFERVQASRAMVETMVARFEALEKHSATVVEKTHRKIREAGCLELESARQDLAVDLRHEIESTSATLRQAPVLDMVARTINASLAKAEEQLAVRTNEQLSKACSGLKRHQERMVDELKEQVNQIVLAAASTLSAKFEMMEEERQGQLAVRSGAALESFQSCLQTLSGEMGAGAAQLFSQKLQKIADELVEPSAEKVRQHLHDAAAATEIFSKELHQRLSAIAAEFFAGASKKLGDGLRNQVEAQLDTIIQTAPENLNERLRQLTLTAGATIVKVSRNQLDKFAGNLFESSSRTLRHEVQQLTDGVRNELKTFQATLADQSRKELLAVARSTIQSLNQEASAGMEKFRAELDTAAQKREQETVRQLEVNVQEAAEKLDAALCALLQQRTP